MKLDCFQTQENFEAICDRSGIYLVKEIQWNLLRPVESEMKLTRSDLQGKDGQLS